MQIVAFHRSLGLVFDQTVIGRTFRLARLAAGLKYRELVARSGISLAQLVRMERGRSEFSLSRFLKLCGVLGLAPGEVIEDAFLDAGGRRLPVEERSEEVNAGLSGAGLSGVERDKAIENIASIASLILFGAVRAVLSTRPAFTGSSGSAACQEALNAFAARVCKLSNVERIKLLNGFVASPVETLRSEGLLSSAIVRDVIEKGSFSVPNLAAWGVRRTQLQGAVSSVASPQELKEIGVEVIGDKAAMRKALDRMSGITDSPRVTVTLNGLRQRVQAVTTAPGSKGRLAKRLGVHRTRLSEWLSGAHEPGAEVAFKLLAWVEEEEAKQQSAAGARTPTAPKTRSRKNENKQPKAGRTRRSGKHGGKSSH